MLIKLENGVYVNPDHIMRILPGVCYEVNAPPLIVFSKGEAISCTKSDVTTIISATTSDICKKPYNSAPWADMSQPKS